MEHPAVAAVASTPALRELAARLPRPGESRSAGGMAGSLPVVVAAALARQAPERLWVVAASSPGDAADHFQDLEALAPGDAVHYPQRELAGGEEEGEAAATSGQRVEAVEAVLAGRARILVATRRALQEVARIPRDLAGLRFVVASGTRPGRDAVIAALQERGFRCVPTVEEVGCYAIRGGIVDVFSLGAAGPARIEFSGEAVDSVRLFDVRDQLSTQIVDSVDILPVAFRDRAEAADRVPRPAMAGGEAVLRGPAARSAAAPTRHRGRRSDGRGPPATPTAAAPGGEAGGTGAFAAGSSAAAAPTSLLDRLPRGAVLLRTGGADWTEDAAAAWRDAARRCSDAKRHGNPAVQPARLFLDADGFRERVSRFARLRLGEAPTGDVVFNALAPPQVDGDLRALRRFLASAATAGAATSILCDNEGQATRLEELVSDRRGVPPASCSFVSGSIAGGFRLPDASPPANVLADHELFRRRRRRPSTRRFRGSASVESLAELSSGDYVVHMDHGIGRFRGLERVNIGGQPLEALVIAYAGGELLRVPVHALDQVERWIGPDPEAAPARLDRIGGKRWKNLRRKTEDAIQAMTAELLDLYAVRKSGAGHAYSADTEWQREMESAFPYEDTPDQRRAAEEVKRDMESPAIMDRLVCGDAGYGKTEVAVRAAFKAVQDGKQVAVLAPTTVLAAQHAGSFRERLDKYPVRVASLSRFEDAAQQRQVLEGIRNGSVDVVVGTHRLLSRDVAFKDLGLLVVDEEQRLGVRQKERIKQLRTTVDVLTLSATPIPRTLYLSLAGIRDMSLIRTPPRNRLPIVTRVVPWHDRIIAEACEREIDRGGQVFFLHNRVETIDTVAARVRDLAAPATVGVAHGRMRPRRLHEAMTRFVDGGTDVLVCSAIIENGLDVANANTLIVDRADRFGLAQLHQIRGRVGRSDRRAFCYLIAPEELADDAARRLSVLEHYTELGSGYQIALRDLQARGAGNLLGDAQSGFAHAVGVETYMRLLEKAVRRIRNQPGEADFPRPEIAMEHGAYLPADYVADERQKLHVYRRLAGVSDRADVAALAGELADRFGPLPPEARSLVDQAVLGLAGRDAGVARIHVKGRRARLDFRPEVAPRMSALAGALDEEDVGVEVPRLSPLAVALEAGAEERLPEIVVRAIDALGETGANARDGSRSATVRGRASAGVAAAVCATLAAGCGGDTLAEAGGARLGMTQAAALIAEHSAVPVDAQVVRTVAELWVDYTLLATRLAADSTLAGLDVGTAVEPMLRERMLAGLHGEALEADTVVSDEELAERFAVELPGAQATASQILLLFPAAATQLQRDSVLAAADMVRRRLDRGDDFAALARAFSDDPGNAQRGGRLGVVERGELLRPVDSAVFGMRPGEVSDPVRTSLGYHVLKLEALDVPELPEVADAFRRRIRTERLAEAEAAFLQHLDSASGLALADDALEVARGLSRSRPRRLAARGTGRPLLTWSGGAYTAGEFAALVRRSSGAFAQGVAEADDDDLRSALRRLGREQALLAEARARGFEPVPATRDSLAWAVRDAIREGGRLIGLHGSAAPSAQEAASGDPEAQDLAGPEQRELRLEADAPSAGGSAPRDGGASLATDSGRAARRPGDGTAARVEAALARILSGRQEMTPLGDVTFLLRSQAAWRIHAGRAEATAEQARALQPF